MTDHAISERRACGLTRLGRSTKRYRSRRDSQAAGCAVATICAYCRQCNTERPHSSLGNLTATEFRLRHDQRTITAFPTPPDPPYRAQDGR